MRDRHYLTSLAVVLAAIAAGCNAGRHSSSGFRLPDSGDIERGKATFVAMGCNTCHKVSGVDLPAPTVQPPVPVVLGGDVGSEMPDGYLVASIINPNYRLAAYPKDQITQNGKSRMPAHTEDMTIQQLTDLVAFLQAHYTVRTVPSRYTSY
jgi:hypothetical protein